MSANGVTRRLLVGLTLLITSAACAGSGSPAPTTHIDVSFPLVLKALGL